MSLSFTERNDKIDALFQKCSAIMSDKGPSYAGTGEANDNFYQIANDIQVSPSTVWSIYFKKHQRSLDSFLNHGYETSEGVQESIKDMINYLAILSTMIDDNWGNGTIREQVELVKPWVDSEEQGSAMAPTPASSIVEVTDPVEIEKLRKAMESVAIEIITISNQRAIHFEREGNMNDFTPDFQLAGVSQKTAELNTP